MNCPDETPHKDVAAIFTGHFVQAHAYSAWRTHGTKDYLLIFTVSGGGRFGFAGGQLETCAGDVVLLRPQTPHDYSTAKDAPVWELLWTHFQPRPHWRDLLLWPEAAPGLCRLSLAASSEVYPAVHSDLSEMHRRATSGLLRREAWAMNALESALLRCEEANPLARLARHDARVEKAAAFLLQNLHRPLTLREAADAADLSASRLSHLFRAETGETPGEFLERERIARAQQLLRLTAHTISEIAAEVGYDNPFYFSLRFKRRTGFSPRNFRRKENAEQEVLL